MPDVIISGKVQHITDRAVLIRIEDINGHPWAGNEPEQEWFPKSQCPDLDNDFEVGEEVEFECPEWLAEEKELV